jgi:hypothetical protein
MKGAACANCGNHGYQDNRLQPAKLAKKGYIIIIIIIIICRAH